MPPVSLDEATRAHRRSVALLGAALVASFFALDALSGPGRPLLLATRAVWATLLLAGWFLFRPGSRVDPRWPEALTTIGSTAATLACVALTGGPESGYFAFLFALPFCIALLLPGALWCAALSGAATTAGGAALLVGAGASRLTIARWVATALGMALLASYATLASRALFRRQIEAEQARARLAEELAENVRRLALAERLAAAGRLAAGVAHEVNNPLAFLRTNVAWLRDHLAGAGHIAPDVAEALDDATHGVDRIARIVADLRGFCAPAPEAPCGAPVADAIAEALRIVSIRLDERVHVSVEADAALPPARICRGRLVQVLGNLVVNASDAAAGARSSPPWIRLQASTRGDQVVVAVEDSGPGLPAEVRAHLFEPFFTTKAPGRGTGLGLALAREYVTVVGGALEAVNAAHGGARFEVELPISDVGVAAGRCPECAYRDGRLATLAAPTGVRAAPEKRAAAGGP